MLNLWGRFEQQAKARVKDALIQNKKERKERMKERKSRLFLFQ